jgi:hypothetical protein
VDRRRRVLVDELRNEETVKPRIFRGDANGTGRRYNTAALQALDAPLVTYVPQRTYSLVLWFLLGLVPVLGLLAADVQLETIRRVVGAKGARPFDLQADGNLVTWFSSLAYGLATLIMLGIYTVRRHRRDDYRGRFTVWRWAIAAALIISVDATAGLHETWRGLCQAATNRPLVASESIWWVGVWFTIFGAAIVRLMLEMSGSRAAVTWMSVASVCYLWTGLVELRWAPITNSYGADVSQVAGLMLGHHFMLFSFVTYARHVVLEAMGIDQTPKKTMRPKSRKSSDQDVDKEPLTGPKLHVESIADDDGDDAKADIAATNEKSSPASKASSPAAETPSAEEVEARKFSKAERRRQRKEQRRAKAA